MPSLLDDVLDRGGNIFVFARNQPRVSLQDGDFAAEAAVHLPKLQADVAAADDDEMLGQKIDLHHRGVCEIADLIETRHGRNDGTAADVDEDLIGSEAVLADCDHMRRLETRLPFVHIDIWFVAQPAFRRLPAMASGSRLCAPSLSSCRRQPAPVLTPNSAARRAT